MPNYTSEKKQLLGKINNPDIIKLLKHAKCFVAGGAVTSIFSGKEINDIDVYFRDYKSLNFILSRVFGMMDDDEDVEISSFDLIYTNHTKKSILFTKDGLNLQLIYFKFFNTAEEIFSTFDFTINMGAYDFSTEQFVLHDNFMKDIAQGRLNVNPNTSFPIISLLRVDKYKAKGYHISRKDFVNLCLAVNRLTIISWEQLADAVGGMYGYTYTEVFDTAKEFSIDEAINQLVNLETNLENIVITSGIDYYELIDKIGNNLNIPIPIESRTFYKKVLKTELPNIFSSYYHPTFKYTVGQFVNGGNSGIWAYKSIRAATNHFTTHDKSKEAILELRTTNGSTIIRTSGNAFSLVGDIEVMGQVIPNNQEIKLVGNIVGC